MTTVELSPSAKASALVGGAPRVVGVSAKCLVAGGGVAYNPVTKRVHNFVSLSFEGNNVDEVVVDEGRGGVGPIANQDDIENTIGSTIY